MLSKIRDTFRYVSADNCGYVLVIVTTFVVFLATVLLAIVAGVGDGIIYPADMLSSYYMFLVDFDIPAWTHYIWIPLGLTQLVWVVYALITLCLRDRQSGFALYNSPGSIPIPTYCLYSCALVCTIGSLSSLSSGYLHLSFVFDLMTALTLYGAIYFTCSRKGRAGPRSKVADLVLDLVANDIGFYQAWIDFLFFVKLGKILVFYGTVDSVTSAAVCYFLYLFYLVSRLFVDAMLYEGRLRNLLVPCFVPIYTMTGVLIGRNRGDEEADMTTIDYVIIALLIGVIFLALVRLLELLVERTKKRK